ncbi:unnamed protein product, partial [Mesorhabditis spiculigera]
MTAPRFVIGVLSSDADIMQIYSALMMGGCSEISFVKELKSSLLCKAQTCEAAEPQTKLDAYERNDPNRRKRKRPQPVREHSPSSSPSSSGGIPGSMMAPSPDANLSLVLNGIVNGDMMIKEEPQQLFHTDTEPGHSPLVSEVFEGAPLLLSQVFGMGNSHGREIMLDENEDDALNAGEEAFDMAGRKKGPVVECMKCQSKIIMQQTRSLFRHIMTHASQEPYRCSECLQSSANSFNLRTHIYRKHEGNAEILPNRTSELEAEWRELAKECFPRQQNRIDRCISYFVHSSETLPLNPGRSKENKMP